MRQFLFAALATLTLGMGVTSCKKTETAPATQVVSQPDYQQLIHAASKTVQIGGFTVKYETSIGRQNWKWHDLGDPWGYPEARIGCLGGSGICVATATIVNIPINGDNDTSGIKSGNFTPPSADFGVFYAFDDVDSGMVMIVKEHVSNLDYMFENIDHIDMPWFPIYSSGAIVRTIAPATRSGHIISLSNENGIRENYLIIYVDKADIYKRS